MPLQGTLEHFGISEIFQLVSQQGKTGTLEIQTNDGVARVKFLEGRLVEAWPDKRGPSELIGTLLVRAGLITQAQIDHALGIQRESLRPLGDILIRSGALRVAEFQEILSLQHRETVFRILRLQRGPFFFRSESVELEEGVSAPMDVGALLMEGFRQLDEWPTLQAKVPGDGRVCVRTDAPVPELSHDKARVLTQVDGVATVRDIVDRSRLGEFMGREILGQLLEMGVVAVGESVRPVPPPTPTRRRAPWAADAALSLLLFGIGILTVALALGGGFTSVRRTAEALRAARGAAVAEQQRARAWSQTAPTVWPGSARAALAGRAEQREEPPRADGGPSAEGGYGAER